MKITKRTHSARRIRCKPRGNQGRKDPCKLRDCSGMRLATGSAGIDRRYSQRDFTKRSHALGSPVRSSGFNVQSYETKPTPEGREKRGGPRQFCETKPIR